MTEKAVSQETLKFYNPFDLLSGLGCLEMAIFQENLNEILIREFYDNLTAEINDHNSPAVGQVYVRG